MPTIRKRGHRYQAIVRKKHHQEVRTFSRKQDAEFWAKELELSIERNSAGLPNSAKNMLFADLCISYKQRAIASKKGLGKTKDNVINRLVRELGHLPAQLQKHHLNTFSKKRLSEGVKPPTLLIDINYVIAILKHGINWMELQLSYEQAEQVKAILAKDGHIDRSDERDRRPTLEELKKLKTHFLTNKTMKIPMATIIDFAVATAMRLGEICKIEWADYNEDASTIAVHARKHPTKKKSHIIPLVEINGIDPHKIIRESASSAIKSGRIFPYNADSVSTAFRRACNKLGIEDLHFHDLRHEAVSSLFEAGLQPQHVMLISGHSNLQQLSRYTNTRAEDVLSHFKKNKAEN